MKLKNYEFKARVDDLQEYEKKLLTVDPEFRGTDHQTDTYFNVKSGRLKLREGNIENALINYDREDISGSKKSDVILYRHTPDIALKDILGRQFGIKVIVSKIRRIYFKGNVKFHFDTVEGLGSFIEVEAIDERDEFTTEQLKAQCDHYLRFFGVTDDQLADRSYSDMLQRSV
ncbi:MAG: class IV adenylate cyclase [Bacteroidales bacterium]|nr:class IV adenylate cyclase [Bacteroidales bacterium]